MVQTVKTNLAGSGHERCAEGGLLCWRPLARWGSRKKIVKPGWLGRRGQQVIEYALVLVAISAALTVMYVYMKRGMQASIKGLVDHQIGPQRDSNPLISATETQSSSSTVDTDTQGTTRIQKTGRGARYIMDMASNSSGTATTIMDQLEAD